MLPQDRINYFLNTEYDNLKQGEYQELVEQYFRAPKDDWYQLLEGRKIWHPNQVADFWKLIRKHTMISGENEKEFNFNGFIFPEFEEIDYTIRKNQLLVKDENFWKQGEKREFIEDVSFIKTTFSELVIFRETTFLGMVNFQKTKFLERVSFYMSSFLGRVSYRKTTFSNKAVFFMSKFSEFADFDKTTFSEEVNFTRTIFLKNTRFGETTFSKRAEFLKTRFLSTPCFILTKFSDKETTLFQDLIFNEEGKTQLSFDNINFTTKVEFRSVNLENASFTQCDIVDVKFKNCNWGGDERIVLGDEKIILKDETEKSSKYNALEDIYRQLKKNFDNNKDWELSGKAYVSEMTMRKRRYKEASAFKSVKGIHAFFSYLIFELYDKLGAYNQSYLRPLFLLVISILVFAFLHSDYCLPFTKDCYPSFDPLRKSIDASLPIFKPTLEYKYWGIRYIQTLLSGTLLTFFILALRKRFKQ